MENCKERVQVLSRRLLNAKDDDEVHAVAVELRAALRQYIEQLRRQLQELQTRRHPREEEFKKSRT